MAIIWIFLISLSIFRPILAQGTCPTKEKQPKFAGIWGEFLLVGFVPVHSPNGTFGCSTALRDGETIEIVETLLYAVDVFNNNSGPWEGTPSISGKLGIIIFDTCQSPQRVAWLLSSWFNGQFHFEDSAGNFFDPQKVVGIAGPLYSSLCLEVTKIAAKENLIEVSYSSSSMALFNQPTFFRTIPADDLQAKAIVELLMHLKAESASILYRNDNYGVNGYKMIVEKMREAQLCLDKQIEIPFDMLKLEKHIRSYLITLHQSKSRFVILFVGWEQAEIIIKHAKDYNNTLVWIGTHPWGSREIFLHDKMLPTALGSFSMTVERSEKTEVRDYISKLRPEENLRNMFFNASFEQYQKCSLTESGNQRPCTANDSLVTNLDPKVDLELKSVWAIALALSDTVQDICGRIENCKEIRTKDGVTKIVDAAKRTTLLNDKGEFQKIFNPRGDGNLAEIVLNIQLENGKPKYQKIGRFNGTLEITGSLKIYNHKRQVVKTPASTCNDCNCLFRNKSDPLMKLNHTLQKKGDVYLIGMIPIHSSIHNNRPSPGGVLQVEVIEAAVDYVNREIFSGDFKLGYLLFDTYSNQEVAAWHMVGLNRLGQYFGLNQYRFNNNNIIALLLNSQGTNTRYVMNIADSQKIIQLDYGSPIGPPATAKNYYFPLKYTIEMELKALVDIMAYFDWKYISVVWSDSAAGNLAYNEVKKLLEKSGICLVNSFVVDEQSFNSVAADMRAVEVEIVLILLEDYHVEKFVDALEEGCKYTLIGWTPFTQELQKMQKLTSILKHVNSTLGVVEDVLHRDTRTVKVLKALQSDNFTSNHNAWMDGRTASNLTRLVGKMGNHTYMNDVDRIVKAICSLSRAYVAWKKKRGSSNDQRQDMYQVFKDYVDRNREQQETRFRIQSYVLAPAEMYSTYKVINIGSYIFKGTKGQVRTDGTDVEEIYGKRGQDCKGQQCSKCKSPYIPTAGLAILGSILVVSIIININLIWALRKTCRKKETIQPYDTTKHAPELPQRTPYSPHIPNSTPVSIIYRMSFSRKDVEKITLENPH